MIRFVTIGALLSLLVLVFYLPSAHPPERFTAQIRIEHQAIAQRWGEARALRILARAVSMQGSARDATPVPTPASAPQLPGVNSAVADEMAAVNQRLFGNNYFRAIDALVLLAAFRLSAMLEWLPWLAAFTIAALADGAIGRVIKSKEFVQHSPERFALYATAAILLACAAVVGMVVPVFVHPVAAPAVVIGLAWLGGRGVGEFHRRG